jgi:hypothetical protein
MKRIYGAALALCSLLALSGCKDVGLEENVPVEQARVRPPKLEAVWITPESPGEPEEAAQAVAVAGSQWVPVAQWHTLPGGYVRQVASVGGRPIYAFAWDEAPYSVLLSPEGAGQYREYRRIH